MPTGATRCLTWSTASPALWTLVGLLVAVASYAGLAVAVHRGTLPTASLLREERFFGAPPTGVASCRCPVVHAVQAVQQSRAAAAAVSS